MRFAALPQPKAEPQRSPAAEFVRKLLGADKPLSPGAQPDREPPADLDQRVRLVGEW
jgi:hypothetical protein